MTAPLAVAPAVQIGRRNAGVGEVQRWERSFIRCLPVSSPAMSAGTSLDVEQLYGACCDRLYAFAYRMLGDRDAALDVVQESFVVALAQADTYRGEAAPLTWLTAIARNLCLRRMRRLRERTFEDFVTTIEAHARLPTSAYSGPERRFYLAEVREGCLIGLLQCLPRSQRCVFVLHVLNDLPIADVASVMCKSQNAVRILLSRARSSMRRFLCRNCALLGGANCECANMVAFSLARHLIAPYQHNVDTARMVHDLRRFADEVELYRSLPDPAAGIAAALESGRFAIFDPKRNELPPAGTNKPQGWTRRSRLRETGGRRCSSRFEFEWTSGGWASSAGSFRPAPSIGAQSEARPTVSPRIRQSASASGKRPTSTPLGQCSRSGAPTTRRRRCARSSRRPRQCGGLRDLG